MVAERCKSCSQGGTCSGYLELFKVIFFFAPWEPSPLNHQFLYDSYQCFEVNHSRSTTITNLFGGPLPPIFMYFDHVFKTYTLATNCFWFKLQFLNINFVLGVKLTGFFTGVINSFVLGRIEQFKIFKCMVILREFPKR